MCGLYGWPRWSDGVVCSQRRCFWMVVGIVLEMMGRFCVFLDVVDGCEMHGLFGRGYIMGLSGFIENIVFMCA